jgi:hypothetical protein
MSVCINGCANVTTDSVVWRAQDVALADYQSLQVMDIFNASGRPISKQSLVYSTEQFKKQLESHGLEVVEQRTGSGTTLLVQTSIVYFEFERAVTGSYNSNATVNETMVSVHVVMLDQSLNRTVTEIKNVITFGSLGFSKLGDRKKTLFHGIAEITADEIAKLYRPANPQ